MDKLMLPKIVLGVVGLAMTTAATAQPLPGGTLDPTTIPKYVTPLVIPPVMKNTGEDDDYDIAVRQFKQQILPGGIWATLPGCTGQNCTFPATTVWSYGPDQDPTPAVAPDPNSQFNYPAYTIETFTNPSNDPAKAITVDWMNELVVNPDLCRTLPKPTKNTACNYLPHLLPIDRSLHWANPEQLPCTDPSKTKDCRPDPVVNGQLLQKPYTGPVPIVVHVHGSHAEPESDGYPEAWWLPDANNIPAGYASTGTLVNQYGAGRQTNNKPGVASFTYRNDQPSGTMWYHDHALGMTRNNVYAGPAGFWLLRDPAAPHSEEDGLVSGTLPGPAPVAGQGVLALNVPGDPVRASIREIPIVIQDRSFNADGTLFYPSDRAFFEGVPTSKLNIPFIGDRRGSDIAPIWNPEAFFNTMVVNGVTWPSLEVNPVRYRFRLLDGCNSRFLNLSLQALDANGIVLGQVPFYQIGAEQGLLPNVVKVETGMRTTYCQNAISPCTGQGNNIVTTYTGDEAAHALLMGLAERADVIVDFSHLPNGTKRVRMINTGPDEPFNGFPVGVLADKDTTGQVMEFRLLANGDPGYSATDNSTPPQDLVLTLADASDPANGGVQGTPRDLALLEEESQLVCATISLTGKISYDPNAQPDPNTPETCVITRGKGKGTVALSVPFAPKAAVLGYNGSGGGTTTMWSDPIVTNPAFNATETWEIWNWTADAHPIHLHEIKLKIVNREAFDPGTGDLSGTLLAPEATEAGWKDTVISYPGQVIRLNATFDIQGLYVWHCHIVEHEDNEMMVPYCVGNKATAPGCNVVP
jgi:spore coat protein A